MRDDDDDERGGGLMGGMDFRMGGDLPLLDEEGEIDFEAAREREMGSFIDKFEAAVVEETAEGATAYVAVACSKGARDSMEDGHCIALDMSVTDLSCFGVFDGHGGAGCSEFIAKSSHKKLSNMVQGAKVYSTGMSGLLAPIPSDKEIQDMCQDLDAEFLESQGGNDSAVGDASGSTGTFAFIALKALSSGEIAYKLKVANVGDSRIIAVRSKRAVTMTRDHKPSDPDEKARIRNAGGWVSRERVDGKLAVSRSFGDTYYKQSDSELTHKVICVPEMSELTLHCGDMVLLCCDGVFESGLTSEDVTRMAVEIVKENPHNVGLAASKICDEALVRGSTDNVTCMIVEMKRIPEARSQPKYYSSSKPTRPFSDGLDSSLSMSMSAKANSSGSLLTTSNSALASNVNVPLVKTPQSFLRLVVLERRADEPDFGFFLKSDTSPQQPTTFATSQDYKGSSPVHVCERWNRVSGVTDGGAAHRAWLRSGMTILSIDGRPVTSRDPFLRKVEQLNRSSVLKVSFTVKADASAWARVRRERVCGGAPDRSSERVDRVFSPSRKGRQCARESNPDAERRRSTSGSSTLSGSTRSIRAAPGTPTSARSMRKMSSLSQSAVSLIVPPPLSKSCSRKKKDPMQRSHSTNAGADRTERATFSKRPLRRDISPASRRFSRDRDREHLSVASPTAGRSSRTASPTVSTKLKSTPVKPLFLRSCAPPLTHSRVIRSPSRDPK